MEISTHRLTDIFFDLIKINATSRNEKPVADYVKNFMAMNNIEVVEDDAGKKVNGSTGNLIAKIITTNSDSIPFAFAAHMDTVKPTEGINPQIVDGQIKTDGQTILGADNRAGIAMILYTIENLKKQNIEHYPFEIIFTIGEETGLFGSTHLDLNKVQSQVAYILDSSADPGYFVYAAPGAIDFTIDFRGKGSHAAVHPEQGINAISMTGQLITNFQVGRVDGNTTINFGKISGGEANNVVPQHVQMTGEIRSFDKSQIEHYYRDLKEQLNNIDKTFGGTHNLERNEAFPGFIIDKESQPVLRLSECMKKVGLEPKPIRYYGGSDANVLNNRGITAIDMGIGAKNPHSTDEYIKIKDMESIVHLMHDLVMVE